VIVRDGISDARERLATHFSRPNTVK
jgi:hypothetical protein